MLLEQFGLLAIGSLVTILAAMLWARLDVFRRVLFTGEFNVQPKRYERTPAVRRDPDRDTVAELVARIDELEGERDEARRAAEELRVRVEVR